MKGDGIMPYGFNDDKSKYDLQEILDEVDGKANASHTHNAGDITGGNLSVGNLTASGKVAFSAYPKILWSSGGWHMNGSQTANLSENVNAQPTGIVLHWQAYVNGAVQNYEHHYVFIPKSHVARYNGAGIMSILANATLSVFGTKYVYVHNAKITGNDNNNKSGTGASGIKYTNGRWVLTEVLGV